MKKTQLTAVKAGFSRLVRTWNAQVRRQLFTAEILRTTTRAEGQPVPFGVTLTLGNRRAEVAVAALDSPDTAHADVARLLRMVANHFDPATPGGVQGDGTDDTAEIQGATPGPAIVDDAPTATLRYRDAEDDIWETVPGTSGPEQLLDVITGNVVDYDHVLSQYGPLTLVHNDQ